MELGFIESVAGTLDEMDFRMNNSQSSQDNTTPSPVEGEFCFAPNIFYMDDQFSVIPQWAEAILTAGNILVIIFAFCGNIAALFVLWKSKTSKRSTRMFLVSLCVSDLILVASSPPFELGVVLDIYHSWVFGSVLCKLVPFVQSMAVMVNAFCLLAIDMERYLSMVCAFRVSVMNIVWQTRIPTMILISIWLISIGITLPNYWSYEHISFWTFIRVDGNLIRPRNETCKYYYLCRMKPSFESNFNVIFYITLGVIFFSLVAGFIFCYISIICFVKSHEQTRKLEGNNNEASKNMKLTKLRHRRTTHLVMGIILLFTICRCPIFIFLLVMNVRKPPVTIVTRCLQYSLRLLSNVNCVIQPFMYAIWNDSLRTGNSHSVTSRAHESGPGRDDSCCLTTLCPCSQLSLCASLVKFCHCNHSGTFDPHIQINENTTPSFQSTQKYFVSSKNEFPIQSTPQSSNVLSRE